MSWAGIRQPLERRLDAGMYSTAKAPEQRKQAHQDPCSERRPAKADDDRPDPELLSGVGDDRDQAIEYLSRKFSTRPADRPGILVGDDAQDEVAVRQLGVRLAFVDDDMS